MITVTQIGRVFVKATRFLHPEQVDVDAGGIRHDRVFALAEADDRFVSTERHGDFFPLTFHYDFAQDRLRLEMPDGEVLEGDAGTIGRRWEHDHHGIRMIPVVEVEGPWNLAISRFVGRAIRVVRCLGRTSALDVLPITFVTTGSLRRRGQELGQVVGAARFRPGFVFDFTREHEAAHWDGRFLKVGSVTLRVRTPVPRCSIPGLDPEHGVRDLEVMKGLIRYRPKQAYPGQPPESAVTPGFATYAEVVEPGTVRLGDKVELLS